MRLNWNEIRVRAAKFAKEWSDAHYEKGETQSFYNDFFDIFGIKRKRVAVYERQVTKLNNNSGFIDLFWPGVLIVEQKSAGRDLKKAKSQAEEYCLKLTDKEFPRYIIVSDFQNFELYDLEENNEVFFSLSELPKNVEHLGFIIGVQKRSFQDQDPVNIKASELMGRVHDALENSGYVGGDLEQFLVRLIFCLFADDTGIFEPRGIFETLIKERTADDGADLGQWISQLFDVLNTPEEKRYKTLDEDLAAFPYVNGELFVRRLAIPAFDSSMRKLLVEACEFSWEAISPAIFGSLFQSVMDKEERRKRGAHYTTEKNILKVIGPLFLDELRAEFERIKSLKTQRNKVLRGFHNTLSELTFFDPACGCGNFLIIAYRELRVLELDVLKALRAETHTQLSLDATELSKVDVDQFYGIEIGEFASRIAEVAMWMMDHIMNNRLSLEFGQTFVRIPLKKSPHIVHGDSLELDWSSVLASEKCTYVFGNPPFGGAKWQTEIQRKQVRKIAKLGKGGGTLDYVSAWFIKAGEYAKEGVTKVGFVATNSVSQGEQVAQLWSILFGRCGLEIAFAHRTFAWGSDARGKAHVHVIIIGLTKRNDTPKVKRLFSYEDVNGEPHESLHAVISPYLIDAEKLPDPHLVVEETSRPINGLNALITGTQPLENGELTFNKEEMDKFLQSEPGAKNLFRPFPGAREFIRGNSRWILHTADLSPGELRNLQMVQERLREVKKFRGKSKRATTKRLENYPSSYGVTVVPEESFLIIPQTSSERREYIPIAWMEPPVIPSEKLRILLGATLPVFAILTSAMHMAWMRTITGRMKSDYMYSVGVVYNTFPMPNKTEKELESLIPQAQKILDERNKYQTATLADLYDPDLMPKGLRKAHHTLDIAVDKLYRKKAFESEAERVEHLFGMYEKMLFPLKSNAVKTKRSIQRK